MAQSGRVKACWGAVEAYYKLEWRISSATEWWQSVDVTITLQAGQTRIPGHVWQQWPETPDSASDSEASPSVWYAERSESESASRTRLGTPEQDFAPRALALFHQGLRSAARQSTRRVNTDADADVPGDSVTIRFVFPIEPGYAVRADIFKLRMVDLEIVDSESIMAFYPTEPVKLLQPLAGDVGTGTGNVFHAIFTSAVGGILLRPLSSYNSEVKDDGSILQILDIELTNRLSFPWITPSPPPTRTLAIVEGGRSSPEHGGTATSIYTAAQALNISMIVLDVPGHWIEGPKYAHWRKEFLPVQLEPPSLLRDRILNALRGYNIDAIVTFCDSYQVAVAQAAAHLGLPTAPAEAYEVATDKYRTGVSEGRPAFLVHSAEEALHVVEQGKLSYPSIVKPCKGFLSEGVFKVHSPDELSSAVKGVNLDRHGAEFVLEAYCDGPEVDINFVLSEGELLFCEVSDDFPKTADLNRERSKGEEERAQKQPTSFVELGNVLPSNLPATEIEILRESLHKSLVRLGLTTGIFHLEARVQNSSVEYGPVLSPASSSSPSFEPEDNIIDLIPRDIPPTAPPSTWLIEINPRPPGIQETAAVENTYGIDYWAIGLLASLRDHARLRSLSYPFAQGPQYHSEMVFIPVSRGGIFDSDDVCLDLIERRPNLGKYISKSFCFLKKGDKVPAPEEGITVWVAYFIVFSRVGREHLLGVTREIRRETWFSIV
ncbi:ATP-grasp domain-containing protein [Aspergillus pseudoustus]|uniref:ATP-grasp domain-containing protein n=1 Tax=Aspergillus pseudoustus TaxID=1810923 RepID=A0ABR4JN27_9EURO